MDILASGDDLASSDITHPELALAARNPRMPLEALQCDITPLGLHYLLIHYDIPFVDAVSWRLAVEGLVERPLTIDLDDLRARPAVTLPVTLECAGNGRTMLHPRPVSQPWINEAVGTAEWTGTPLAGLLEEAGVRDEALELVFTGADAGVEGGRAQHYERSLTVEQALRGDVLVAYAINGEPLPPQHGFPVRLVVPGWYGMASVKWLVRITAVNKPFDGYQQARAYRLRQVREESGVPLSVIAVRALMAPPGVAEFPSRRRHVPREGWGVVGRAWSGAGAIERVEVSDDDGRSWSQATVEPAPGPHAWHRWTYWWEPDRAGDMELWCRATDAAGHTQPIEPAWNLGGYAVNAVQRVPVTVAD